MYEEVKKIWPIIKGRKIIETDSQIIQIFELADKDFKITVINMLKTEDKMRKMDDKMENCNRNWNM